MLDADPQVLARVAPVVQRIARAVKTAFAADGVTIVQFNEPASGQTVFHLHYHVIPRHEGVALMPHSRDMEQPDVLAANAEKIRKALCASVTRCPSSSARAAASDWKPSRRAGGRP